MYALRPMKVWLLTTTSPLLVPGFEKPFEMLATDQIAANIADTQTKLNYSSFAKELQSLQNTVGCKTIQIYNGRTANV